MKYKLLSVSKSKKIATLNIGDYIQALASSQYYPQIDGFIDRDIELKDYNGEECKIIMNGWYMHNPENWPPSNKIKPLFVAFHINSTVQKDLTSESSIAYLKRNEPIGCRDYWTTNLLKNHGVNSYFSGCMTLTLGKTFNSLEKENKTYIVDPIFDPQIHISNVLTSLVHYIKHFKDINSLFKATNLFQDTSKKITNKIKRLIKIILYYISYTKIFSKDLIINSIYINHESQYYREHFLSDEERLKEAENLIRLYSKAKLVITSRIHCALPCLGLNTPVIFLKRLDGYECSECRFDGIINLLNVIEVDSLKLTPKFHIKGEISTNNLPPINSDWTIYSKDLDNRCTEFMNK